MPRYAVIDVGTNSVKFYIGERADDGRWHSIIDRAKVTRLGEGLQERGAFGSQAMERTLAAIASMVAEARQNGADAIAAVGTMGMRSARNADRFIEAVRERCGVMVEVITGEEEGRLAYLAVKAGLGLPDVPLAVFETGGGSSQFTFGHGATVDQRFSLDVGAVRYTERYGLDRVVSAATLHEALDAIGSELSRLDSVPSPETLVGMGGAVTNMAAVKLALPTYDPDAVQGMALARADVEQQIELYRSHPAESRRAIVGLQTGREEVILAGACIVKAVMEKLHKDTLRVSDRGLRHGLLIDRFSTRRSTAIQ